jgi:hypothetical protein
VREHGNPDELAVTVEPYAEPCGWVRVGVVVMRNELASRGVVGHLRNLVFCRSDGLRGGSVARPAIAPSLIQCQGVLHETSDVRCKSKALPMFKEGQDNDVPTLGTSGAVDDGLYT